MRKRKANCEQRHALLEGFSASHHFRASDCSTAPTVGCWCRHTPQATLLKSCLQIERKQWMHFSLNDLHCGYLWIFMAKSHACLMRASWHGQDRETSNTPHYQQSFGLWGHQPQVYVIIKEGPHGLCRHFWAVDNKRQVCEAHSLNHQHFSSRWFPLFRMMYSILKPTQHETRYMLHMLLVLTKSPQRNMW